MTDKVKLYGTDNFVAIKKYAANVLPSLNAVLLFQLSCLKVRPQSMLDLDRLLNALFHTSPFSLIHTNSFSIKVNELRVDDIEVI